MLKEREQCPKCKEVRYMTRHHLKNEFGKKTGEVEIMCRDCHDDVEVDYNNRGITDAAPPKITSNEKLSLDYMEGLIPFYATKQAMDKRHID